MMSADILREAVTLARLQTRVVIHDTLSMYNEHGQNIYEEIGVSLLGAILTAINLVVIEERLQYMSEVDLAKMLYFFADILASSEPGEGLNELKAAVKDTRKLG